MANSADPDQLASEEANWSGSTLFVKAGYIQVQQDNGKASCYSCFGSIVLKYSSWTEYTWIRSKTLFIIFDQ